MKRSPFLFSLGRKVRRSGPPACSGATRLGSSVSGTSPRDVPPRVVALVSPEAEARLVSPKELQEECVVPGCLEFLEAAPMGASGCWETTEEVSTWTKLDELTAPMCGGIPEAQQINSWN